MIVLRTHELLLLYNREPLAQLVEHLTFNQRVAGSNPAWLTISFKKSIDK